MKRFAAILLITVLVFACFVTVACNDDNVRVYIHLHYGDGSVQTIEYTKGMQLPVPSRDGYTFDGWFYDAEATEPFDDHTEPNRSVDLFAGWTENISSVETHVVTLVFADGATADRILTVADGLPATLPTPERSNYRFDGWWTEPIDGTQYTNQPINNDITLFAHWTELTVPTSYTVTLYCNDGVTLSTDITVEEGDSAELPTSYRAGYAFEGWYTSQSFADAERYIDQPINGDITLYAKWTATDRTQYTVTFLLYGNSKTVRNTDIGQAAPTVNPLRTGYTFGGWFYDEEFTYKYIDQPIVHDITLYAKWISKPHVTLKFMDGSTADKEVYFAVGETPLLPSDPTRKGYNFVGWYTDEDRTERYQPAPATESFTLYAKWATEHAEHIFDSYFMFVECSYEGCKVVGRAEGSRLYDNKVTFDFAKRTGINSHFNACQTALNQSVEQFVKAFSVYEQDLNYLVSQYYWATLYYDVNGYDYTSVVNCYGETLTKYYRLFVDADKAFGTQFWTLYGGDRDSTLDYATSYLDQEETDASIILSEYSRAIGSYYTPTSTFNGLYGRLVDAYNKEAQGYGYENYMEYAYSDIYNREYTPADTYQMHAYVKQYIAPALVTVNKLLNRTPVGNSDNSNFFDELTDGNIVGANPSEIATNYIGEYFKWMRDNSNPDKPIDFYSAANNMFRDGNCFVGNGGGAYTMNVAYDNVAAIYIQRDNYAYSYDSPFTFVHEFGHYYNYFYNGERYLSYDHAETHSQGDEMLFLAWLKANKPQGISAGMKRLELSQLENILHTICMSSAVDELESAAYVGEYNGKPINGNYHELFGEILDSYGTDAGAILKANGNQSYWYYVVFDNAAYYISYAMSALPATELYTIAERDGLENARATYFKLFTYCDDDLRMENYTYSDALRYCGLDSPFEQNIFTHIADYVNSL